MSSHDDNSMSSSGNNNNNNVAKVGSSSTGVANSDNNVASGNDSIAMRSFDEESGHSKQLFRSETFQHGWMRLFNTFNFCDPYKMAAAGGKDFDDDGDDYEDGTMETVTSATHSRYSMNHPHHNPHTIDFDIQVFESPYTQRSSVDAGSTLSWEREAVAGFGGAAGISGGRTSSATTTTNNNNTHLLDLGGMEGCVIPDISNQGIQQHVAGGSLASGSWEINTDETQQGMVHKSLSSLVIYLFIL